MRGVMIHGIVRDTPALILSEGFAGVGIDVEPWEIAARNIDPDAVPLFEHVGGREWIDLQAVDLPGRPHFGLFGRISIAGADYAVAHVHLVTGRIVVARRIDIDKLRGEIRARRV